ncbi:transglutaminase family protein [Pigmentiphaga soli]|uniref:Transglutaminase family protein n=1 Tax=Pigmentiphaga soli TaxID=1007095 RepID=A0ABP8GE92_9BURK
MAAFPSTGRPACLSVTHETAYRYASPVELAHHVAYLRPLETPYQTLRDFELQIEPRPSSCIDESDVYGNARALFELLAPHDFLRVRAVSRVCVSPRFAGLDGAGGPPWEEAARRWRYVSGAPYAPESEFVFASPYVPLHAPLRAYARESFTPGRGLVAAAVELMHRIHRDFTYESNSTAVSTPLLEAFEARHGVCQDFAHVAIGCLRALGLAARYVSGYLLSEPPPGQPRLVGADASHAWLSVYVPGLEAGGGWLDLDPTNDLIPGAAHVTLAHGRDYGDVTPLRGVIRGGGGHELQVAVTVEPDAGSPR